MAGQGKAWGQRRRNSRGAVAVEFALVLPLLGMLLFGIITFGLAFSDKVALVNAVREGARFGASTDATASWASSVVDRTVQLYANADSPLTANQVCALLVDSAHTPTTTPLTSAPGCNDGTAPAGHFPNPPTAIPPGSCYVMVWAAKPTDVNWLVHTTTLTLSAESVGFYDRVSGTGCTYTP